MAPCKLHMQSAEKSKSAVCRAIVVTSGPERCEPAAEPHTLTDCRLRLTKNQNLQSRLQSNSRYVLHMVCSIFVQLHGLFE